MMLRCFIRLMLQAQPPTRYPMKYLMLAAMLMPCFCLAQKRPEPIYYDAEWKECEMYKAHFFGFKIKTDSGHRREDFYAGTKRPQMIASYADEAEQIPHGVYATFYPDGSLRERATFNNGKRNGLYVSFYPDGMMNDSVMYNNNDPVGIAKAWHSNGYISDSTSYQRNGLAVSVEWFDNGNPSAAGRFMHGKPEGKWQYFHANGNLAKTVTYVNGEETAVIFYNSSGEKTDEFDRDTEPYFGKSVNDWTKYVNKKLFWPNGVQFKDDVSATVEVTFTVNYDGTVKDAFVSLPLHPEFDRVALDIIKRSNQWHAGIEHNRVVQKRFRQRMTFSQK